MPKQLSDEHVALVRLTAAPEDPAAITVTEFDAGERFECRVETFRASPVASDTVNGGEFCRAINAVVPTRSNFEASMVVYRYLTEEGLADATNDVAFEAVRERGTVHHFVVRKGPKHDEAGAAGQEYSYFEVINDHPQDPADWGGFLRSEVTLYVQRAELNKELVTA